MSHAARVADAMDRLGEAREIAPTFDQQPDLFVQERIASLRAEAEAMSVARDRAQQKVRCAPHGTYKARLAAFADLTHQLLVVEGQLNRAIRESHRG